MRQSKMCPKCGSPLPADAPRQRCPRCLELAALAGGETSTDGDEVALEMIRGDLHVDPERLGRFRVVAEAVAQLGSPHVVQIYEVGEVGGLPHVSLERLEGGTLAERLARAPLALRQAGELAATLARAEGVDQRGRPASRDSLASEARAADLLRQALERTPAERRPAFRRHVVARDACSGTCSTTGASWSGSR